MSRFCIIALFRPEGVSTQSWDWARIRHHLSHRCGELSAGWSLTAQHVHHPSTGESLVVVRAAPEQPNMEAWGELYASSEALARALSEALDTLVAVVAFELGDERGLYARWDRGSAIEPEARVANPLALAAEALGGDEHTLRRLVALDDVASVLSADPEIDAEDFTEQQWLNSKRREAQQWMERYRTLKQHGRAGGSEETTS